MNYQIHKKGQNLLHWQFIVILSIEQSGQQFAIAALAQGKQVIAIDIQAVNSLRQILQEQTITRQKMAHIQINDPRMVEILQQYPSFIKEDKQLKLISFNKHCLAARRLLQTYPLYQYADLRGQDRVRVAIFGFTHQAQQLLLQLALNSHYRDFKQPHIIICDKQATKQGQEFLNHNSGLKDQQICKLDFIDFDIETQAIEPLLQTLETQVTSAYGQNITAILICYEQESQNLSASLQLRIKTQQTRLALAPIFVSMTQDLEELSVSIEQTPHFEQVIQHFGQKTSSWQEIVETSSDKLAKFIHNAYNSRYGNGTKWQDLTETYRDANRRAADHIAVKLASLEYYIPEDPSNWSEKVDLTENQELLAKLEHKRWYAERRLNGWQYGPKRDDNRNIHPCLVPYEQLSEQEKQKDRTNIQDLQEFFSSQQPKSGQQVRKNINIAILATKESQLEKKNKINNILKKYHEYHITLMTALQNQQELELAKIAIKQAQRLIIPSPYPNDLQKEIKAEWIIDLLPAGKQPTSLTTEEREIQQQRAVIYQLERADVVIMFGENPQWMRWRQGKEKIPEELSSIPVSLNRKIPNELIVV